MSMMESVIRLTDRFYDPRDPDTIERQSKLQQCILIVLICYVIAGIAFYKMKEWEVAHPRIIHDVDVTFEFTPPPPEPPPMAQEMGRGPGLSAGGLPGSAPAPAPAETAKVAMPTPQAPTITKPTPVPVKPIPSRKTTVAAPIAVTPTNVIKAPIVVPKPTKAPTQQNPQTGTPVAANPSGAPNAAGAPGGVDGGAGTGGAGGGGTGTGQGGLGAGTGGGGAPQIAMSLGTNRAMGNIAPYRKDLLMRLAQNWKPKNPNENIIVLIDLATDGSLISAEIFQSSGNKKSDKAALAAIEETKFAPLPDWYKGKHLPFKIELSKVEALHQQ
jgi:TonB family protein